jgi:hypothetical protein
MPECAACGAEVSSDDVFCGECGKRLDQGADATQAHEVEAPAQRRAPTPAVQEPPVTTPEPPPTPPTPVKPPPPTLPTVKASPPPARSDREPRPAVTLPRPPADSPLLGKAVPNEQYLGMRLTYAEGEAESLDPLGLEFMKALFMHWVQWFFTTSLALAILLVLGVRSSGVLGWTMLILVVVFLFLPVWVSISEWKFMVDGQAVAAPQAFEHIAWVFQRRETPVERLRVQRLKLSGEASRDYLYAHLGIFRGYISCFAFGQDLYIGWIFWWRLSTVRWWLLSLQRMYQRATLRGSELHTIHRYDNAKAMREALHGSAREGVDAASGAVSFQGSGTIGTDIPIDTVGLPREGLQRQPSRAPG